MRVKSSARRSDAARLAAGRSTRSVKRFGLTRGTQLGARSLDFVSRPPGGSSSGRTTDSDSVYLGSNPSPPANWRGPAIGRSLFYLAAAQAWLAGLDAERGADQQYVCRARREQSDGHHARDLVELTLERDRISDAEIVDVEDVVAAVGDESLAPQRSATARGELPGDQRARHGNDLDRQRVAAERGDHLGVVDDAPQAPP